MLCQGFMFLTRYLLWNIWFHKKNGGLNSQTQHNINKCRRLKERKKKHKNGRREEAVDFQGHEEIKFGEVVEAPPKLIAVPKVRSPSLQLQEM